MKKIKVAVLCSGGGTNLQAIIDFAAQGKLRHGSVELVISDRSDAYALERARQNGIATAVFDKRDIPDRAIRERRMLECLDSFGIELVVLAGFMTVIGKEFVDRYSMRIINIHPALIPSFAGMGMYGLHVHEAALQRGVKITGATVHYVNEVCDGGPIIEQKAVRVRAGDTPETLQKRVMREAEWSILPRSVEKVCKKLSEE